MQVCLKAHERSDFQLSVSHKNNFYSQKESKLQLSSQCRVRQSLRQVRDLKERIPLEKLKVILERPTSLALSQSLKTEQPRGAPPPNFILQWELPRSVKLCVSFSVPEINFVQFNNLFHRHTLYPVSMSYVIGGGVHLIDSHLMEPLQVEFSFGASVKEKKASRVNSTEQYYKFLNRIKDE